MKHPLNSRGSESQPSGLVPAKISPWLLLLRLRAAQLRWQDPMARAGRIKLTANKL